VGEVQLMLMKN